MLRAIMFWIVASLFFSLLYSNGLQNFELNLYLLSTYFNWQGFLIGSTLLLLLLFITIIFNTSSDMNGMLKFLFKSRRYFNNACAIEKIDDGLYFAVIEFDEQGMLFEPKYMDQVAKWLAEHKSANAIVITFNHGWFHNAHNKDSNMSSFKSIVCKEHENEKKRSSKDNFVARPIFAIYIAWQGMIYASFINYLSFWNRSSRVFAVAQGSVRELHARLSEYRAAELKSFSAVIRDKEYRGTVLVHIGHSFGAYMLFSAQSQALISAAVNKDYIFDTADLLIIINPAFSAISYLPVRNALRGSHNSNTRKTPVFVCMTSDNDWCTRYAFRIGKCYQIFLEGFSNREQRHALTTTIAHNQEFLTHNLLEENGKLKECETPNYAHNPFWIIKAPKNALPSHSNIRKPVLTSYISSLIERCINERS